MSSVQVGKDAQGSSAGAGVLERLNKATVGRATEIGGALTGMVRSPAATALNPIDCSTSNVSMWVEWFGFQVDYEVNTPVIFVFGLKPARNRKFACSFWVWVGGVLSHSVISLDSYPRLALHVHPSSYIHIYIFFASDTRSLCGCHFRCKGSVLYDD